MTAYIVFAKLSDDEFLWSYMSEGKARSSRTAITEVAGQTAEADLEKPVLFAAVPARSWKPIKVKVEKALKFS